jgi:hypothetical protein
VVVPPTSQTVGLALLQGARGVAEPVTARDAGILGQTPGRDGRIKLRPSYRCGTGCALARRATVDAAFVQRRAADGAPWPHDQPARVPPRRPGVQRTMLRSNVSTTDTTRDRRSGHHRNRTLPRSPLRFDQIIMVGGVPVSGPAETPPAALADSLHPPTALARPGDRTEDKPWQSKATEAWKGGVGVAASVPLVNGVTGVKRRSPRGTSDSRTPAASTTATSPNDDRRALGERTGR